MAASLSGAEVLLAAWAHGGLDVKKPAVKGNKVEYTSCVGDVCTKHAFVPLPTDGGRTFAPSTALVVRLITSPVAFAIVPGMGFLAFVSLTSSRPTNHLLALLDNPYATGAAHPVLGRRHSSLRGVKSRAPFAQLSRTQPSNTHCARRSGAGVVACHRPVRLPRARAASCSGCPPLAAFARARQVRHSLGAPHHGHRLASHPQGAQAALGRAQGQGQVRPTATEHGVCAKKPACSWCACRERRRRGARWVSLLRLSSPREDASLPRVSGLSGGAEMHDSLNFFTEREPLSLYVVLVCAFGLAVAAMQHVTVPLYLLVIMRECPAGCSLSVECVLLLRWYALGLLAACHSPSRREISENVTM